MQKHSKHISEFTSTQILKIVNWGREFLNLTAEVLERKTTKIVYEQVEGGIAYLAWVDVNGNIVKPKK